MSRKNRSSSKVSSTPKKNRSYKRGYSLENFVSAYLSYHGWHVKRNYRSLGVEDLTAVKKCRTPLLIQCKNSKAGVKAMSQQELLKLREHAEQYGAIGIYVYSDSRKKYLYDTSTSLTHQLVPIPKKEFDMWRDLNNKHKAEKSILSCNCYFDPSIKHIYL